MKPTEALALAAVLVACGTRTEPAAPVAPRPSPAPAVTSSPSATRDASADAPDAAVRAEAPPAPVERTGKDWPYHAYDRAEAVAFNPYSERNAPADFDEYVYSARGWNHHVTEHRPITLPQAVEAIGLLRVTGELETTKCTFPRHAVVLYEGTTPVASINVCFECAGLLTWPEWRRPAEPQINPLSAQALAKWNADVARFDKNLLRWKHFFQDEVGLPVDHRAWMSAP